MALTDQCKETIRANPIGRGLLLIRESYTTFVSKAVATPSFDDIANSINTDQGAQRFVAKLLQHVSALDAAHELPSHQKSHRETLSEYLILLSQDLRHGLPSQLNTAALATLLQRVIEQADDELIWKAVYEMFDEAPIHPPSRTIYPPPSRDSFLHDLHSDWEKDFLGDALIGLRQQMRDCVNSKSPYYAKTLVFVQSSGMGKSRLADSFGRICPMINFVLREEGNGYPPSDRQVEQFMRQPIPHDIREAAFNSPSKNKRSDPGAFSERRVISIWNHCIAFAILEASFKKFNDWVEKQNCAELSLEELARRRHEEMKPINASDVADQRSQKRIEFSDQVVTEAQTTAERLALDKSWRQLFNEEKDSAFRAAIERSKHMKQLCSLAKTLTNNLAKGQDRNLEDKHLLVVVFDEVASLFRIRGSSKSDAGRYVALNRIFSCLKQLPVWFFLLSTESKIEKILPPDIPIPDDHQDLDSTNQSSARIAFGDSDEKLRVFPPFVAFPLDIEDQRRMRDKATRKAELVKPMVEFSEPSHMATFGRRLWCVYSNANQLFDVAKFKVIGGNNVYNPLNNHHVFAVLSFRLALDTCVETTISLPLLRTAVGFYMRVVISVDQRTGFLCTTTPSEPILANAAMMHLCKRTGNWLFSITTLSRELLQQGLIEKGLKGELFSRVLLILAHDSLRGVPGLAVIPTFTVKDFLLALYASNHHELIENIDDQILQAGMNFTHFTSTNDDLLPGEPTISLCHDLLRRCAALQLSHDNPAFDQLIPIYFDNGKSPFDRSKCGAIVIQNKNKGAATTPDYIFGEGFVKIGPRGRVGKVNNQDPIRQKKTYAFTEMNHPILFLLFDLGTEPGISPPVQISRTTDTGRPPVWAIHSRGHTEAIFGCLKTMGVENAVETFFSASVEENSIYHQIARRNLVFDHMTRSSRYASPKADGSGYSVDVNSWREDDDDGEDIDMKDA